MISLHHCVDSLGFCRALGQYAQAEQTKSKADDLVQDVFRDLEAFDFILFDYSRRGAALPLDDAGKKLKAASAAFDGWGPSIQLLS